MIAVKPTAGKEKVIDWNFFSNLETNEIIDVIEVGG